MPEEQAVAAALAWADRNERGDADSYDPYIVALAQVVREQQEYIKGLERRTGIPADVTTQKMVIELSVKDELIDLLVGALRPFAENWDMYASDHVSVEGIPYRLFRLSVVEEIARAMTKAKAVLTRFGTAVASESS